MQKHHNPLSNCEVKFEGEAGVFTGYASVFNGLDSYNDTILPGAFEKTLKSGRLPHMFINHNSYDIPVGDWMSLSEDDTGLKAEGQIDLIHRDGPTLHSAMMKKRMDGLSIGFRIPAGGAEESKSGGRIINAIDLVEISVVTSPADDSARITAVKSEIETINTIRDAELFLRDSGQFSRSTAIAFASRFKSIIQSDSDGESKEIAERLTVEKQNADLLTLIKNFKG